MSQYRFYKMIVRVAAISTIAAFLFSCENDIQKIKSFENNTSLPMQSASDMEIIYSDSAIVKLAIDAPAMERYISEEQGNYILFKKGIHVRFFGPDLTVQTDLKANYARHLESENIWEVSDNVVIVNKKGEVINTELLIWDREKAKIHSDKYVKITTPDEIIMGDGFESDEQFLNYVILNVTGTINLKEEE